MKRIEYTPNQIINGLIFLKEAEPHILPSKQVVRKGLFRCFCGTEFEAMITHIKRGVIVSCGCYKRERAMKMLKKHGMYGHAAYPVWNAIMQRCFNEKRKDYVYYGGRGITVCKEWRNSPTAFIDWALSHGWGKGLTIDRRNNDGNYEPSNCRFITQAENNRNKRGAQC